MPRESKRSRRDRSLKIQQILEATYPDAECELIHTSPLQLLIATILSAQCTDKRVNKVTPALFDHFRSAKDFANSPPGELESFIHSTGFYNNKAKNIRGACRNIVEKFHGEVPQSMKELLTLPGVARKTASVVMGVAFGKAEGVVVDTHVQRISQRLKLTKENTPVKIERDLMDLLPQDTWIHFSHLIIWHGRDLCPARKPRCSRCPLLELCPHGQKEANA
ncbi:MAG: endonuclease III [Planctomycetota bacterium]|jgi:endonuclease-3|nr:endonuclease III [Planctomycetota bacterium]